MTALIDRAEKLFLMVGFQTANDELRKGYIEEIKTAFRAERDSVLQEVCDVIRNCGTNQPCQQCVKVINGMFSKNKYAPQHGRSRGATVT
jgi:hypothetical protein